MDADVVISGGGPIGLLLALALERSPLRVLQVAPGTTPPDRPLALSHGSRLLLDRMGMGVFGELHPTDIDTIHVSQRQGFGRTLIRAIDYGLPALGCVVSYRELVETLQRLGRPPLAGHVVDWQRERESMSVRWMPQDGEQAPRHLHARLLVVADGMAGTGPADGQHGGRDYGQNAVVAHVRTELPHRHRAWERFTPQGPLALLPDGARYSLVWSTSRDHAQALCRMDERSFLQRLSDEFGTRLGRFIEAGRRASFPLALRYGSVTPAAGVVAIGNAAQTLHPVAGQGLNLGLRDAWELAQLLGTCAVEDIGSASFGERFARRRKLDRQGGIGFTDALVRLFSGRDAVLAASRGAGLTLLDVLPPARRFLAHRMMYGARAFP